jgi:hypothetical protein
MWTQKEKTKWVGPVVIERALKGLEFPAAKEEIIQTAERNNAPDDAFFALDQLEERNYSGLEDILLELT